MQPAPIKAGPSIIAAMAPILFNKLSAQVRTEVSSRKHMSLLRVIPSLTSYPDEASDISSGSIIYTNTRQILPMT